MAKAAKTSTTQGGGTKRAAKKPVAVKDLAGKGANVKGGIFKPGKGLKDSVGG